MPGVRVAGQCERAAPFRFVAFVKRFKVGQTGWARARVSGLGTEEEIVATIAAITDTLEMPRRMFFCCVRGSDIGRRG